MVLNTSETKIYSGNWYFCSFEGAENQPTANHQSLKRHRLLFYGSACDLVKERQVETGNGHCVIARGLDL